MFTRQFSRALTPGHSSLGFSRESPVWDIWCYVAYVYHGEMFSLIGNQRLRADCQAHICMNKRERGRERVFPLHFIRAPPCCAVGRFISRRPRWIWLLPVWKCRPLTRVGDWQGQLVYEYCIYNGRREREREGERERREERERDGERVPCSIMLFTKKWEKIASCVYPTIFPCVDPRPKLSRFFTGISRRRYVLLRRLCLSWGNVFPHRESTSWNFPAKIKNSLRPIPSFDMMSKFPGWDHSCKRRYVA